ncbi:hypothetical protein B5X24_HaOG212322 [Helicoverpa armigera]|nr:hypothetical protein B5X24_HaOG212322 [Helicoverpa armigera]
MNVIVLGKTEQLKLAKLTHGDSLDDVEGFPEDHVTDYVHKLPHIAEMGSIQDKDLTSDFLRKEREAQLKRETVKVVATAVTESVLPQQLTQVTSDVIIPAPLDKVETTTDLESVLPEKATSAVVESAKSEKVLTSAVPELSQTEKDITSVVTEIAQPTKSVTTVVTESVQPERVVTTVVTETVQPVKEVRIVETVQSEHDQHPREIVFTTRQTETSYTISSKDEPTVISEVKTFIKDGATTTVEEIIETKQQVIVREGSSKFDVSKIRTDTLGHFDVGEIDQAKKFVPKDLDLEETTEITKEQVKPVIDDILHKGTIAAAARSPVLDKDIKTITKEIVETEKRSYDAKVPHKEERRHSCISPAISLERIAESEVETEEEPPKPVSLVAETQKVTEIKTELKKSDSAMKQMADNIEIIIKQASEDIDLSSEEHAVEDETQDIAGRVSVDSIIEEAVTTVEGYLDEKDAKEQEIEAKKEIIYEETKKFAKERPGLIKSLSRDSGEIVIMPKKKHPRTFSVQSSPEEVEEQIYTDSESDMDKAKVLEIIEPSSDIDGKTPASSFDTRKIRTDSLDDADDFPEKEAVFFGDDEKYMEDAPESFQAVKFDDTAVHSDMAGPSTSSIRGLDEDDKFTEKFVKKTHFVDSLMRSDLVSKSTTESSVTTVISTLTKSSDEDQKSVLEDGTSADFSKISGADLVKDPSKTSMEAKDDSKFEEQIEDRGTPDLSKKSIDLTKDYSKSSIDSKDTSRDFATNELSKDSTVDLTKDFSKASVESVKETSRSIDEKTFSEDHSSLDVSKTLASDASEGITISKEFIEEERSVSRVVRVSTSSSQETSILTESKLFSEQDEKSYERAKPSDRTEQDFIGEMEEKIAQLQSEFRKEEESIKDMADSEPEVKVEKHVVTKEIVGEDGVKRIIQETHVTTETVEHVVRDMKEFDGDKIKKELLDDQVEDADILKEAEDEVPDMKELNRRCSNLLEDISQGALIRIDSSHVTHDLVSKFSKTPPPSPVDLTLKEKSKTEDGSGEKPAGLQPKGSDSSFLDASRQSPRASSAGDSVISETEAHQSDLGTKPVNGQH